MEQGHGVSINPVAFLVVQGENVKLMPVDHDSCIDKLLDYIPDLMQRVNDIFNKKQNETTLEYNDNSKE